MADVRIPIPDIEFHPPVYSCIRAKSPFIPDGNLDKAFWNDAPFTELFVDIEGEKKEKPRFRTRVKMMWDDDNLYIGAVLEGDEIWATLTERDCVIFQDNDFEIFIDPDSDTHQYFEFEMNALGTVWDLFLTKPYRDFGGSPINGWDIHGLQCAVMIDGELNNPLADNRRWMAEITIPFAALKEGNGGRAPKPGDYYRMNFSRVQWDVEAEEGRYQKLERPEHNWVWSPTGLINIHYPELWGFVFFTKHGESYPIPADERLKWELRKVYYAQHKYFDEKKVFGNDLKQLGLSGDSMPGFEMEVTAHGFELSCTSTDMLHRIGMFADGKTWVYEHITSEGCLEFLHRFMPISDRTDYEDELFTQFIDHARMVRETVLWGDQLSLELFLNYVLQYRVNNEDIIFDRKLFFDEIYPRIQGMGMYEAALEVNYWCFEKATYQSTDIRTASAITVIKNACGRCGEESGLAVAALRSVGIPARQCYTPRWSHCDDNHAWVEVWIDGEWHFLGACEPEARLDRGWFCSSASKGMLIHNRVLTDLVTDEVITRRSGHMLELNGLARYADTKEICVRVVNGDGHPISGAGVRFEVVNFSEFFPLTTLTTDENGEVRFLTGLGDLMVYAFTAQSHGFSVMDVRVQVTLTLVLNGAQAEDDVAEYRFVPPVGGVREEVPLSSEEALRHTLRMEQSAAVRKAYEQTFLSPQKCRSGALPGLESLGEDMGVEVDLVLSGSRGNQEEILTFLQDEETKEELLYKVRLLKSLKTKDLTDITAEILKEHLVYALPYADQMPEDLFCEAVLCPRIWIEPIRAYRKAILRFFKEAQLESFKREPLLLGEWIKTHIEVYEDGCYANLSASPAGLLRLKKGNEISGRILFVAVLRTIGIPARLDQADLCGMYFHDGKWNRLSLENEERDRDAVLILKKQPEETLEYLKNYTVSFLHKEVYRTLDFRGMEWGGDEIRYEIPAGACRIVLSDRLPCQTNLVRVYYTVLQPGEECRVEVALPKAESEGAMVELPDFAYETPERKFRHLYEDLPDGAGMAMWLSVGEEPTEHLLNELIEAQEGYQKRRPDMVLVVKTHEDLKDPTLQKAWNALPFIKVRIGYEPGALTELFDGFAITDQRFPLAVVTKGHTGVFAWSGYQVGTGDLLLKNLECV